MTEYSTRDALDIASTSSIQGTGSVEEIMFTDLSTHLLVLILKESTQCCKKKFFIKVQSTFGVQ